MTKWILLFGVALSLSLFADPAETDTPGAACSRAEASSRTN